MGASPTLGDLLREHWQLARTLRRLQIDFEPELCVGLFECLAVCPVNCWEVDSRGDVAVFIGADRCIACKACVLQCKAGAIELRVG